MNARVDLPPAALPSSAGRRAPDELRAWRLGTALSAMAHDLAGARREIAVLRRENSALRARLDGGNLRPQP
jgi:hypothetical protein